jgi:glutamate-1-semialdehyde 2,1-aminomutase
MGLVPPSAGFLAGLRERCTAHGILLIFDEVISGFRASAGGAQSVYGVRADLTCLG